MSRRETHGEHVALPRTSVISSKRLLSAAEVGRRREPNRALALNGRCRSSRTCEHALLLPANPCDPRAVAQQAHFTLNGLVKP